MRQPLMYITQLTQPTIWYKIVNVNDRIRETVRQKLKTRDMTQVELAREADIRQSHISRYLSGDSGKVPQNWQSIFNTLDLEVTALDKDLLDKADEQELVLTPLKPQLAQKLEQLTTLHGEDWLLDRLEVLATLEGIRDNQ